MSAIAWEADVLPLNYARIAVQRLDFMSKSEIIGRCLPHVNSTDMDRTELVGAKSPAKVPQVGLPRPTPRDLVEAGR